jgi:hypothetical protein
MIKGTDMINSILHIDCGLTDLLQPIDQLGRTEGQAEKNAAENHAQSSPARVATFGPFCVHTAERVLERGMKTGTSCIVRP